MCLPSSFRSFQIWCPENIQNFLPPCLVRIWIWFILYNHAPPLLHPLFHDRPPPSNADIIRKLPCLAVIFELACSYASSSRSIVCRGPCNPCKRPLLYYAQNPYFWLPSPFGWSWSMMQALIAQAVIIINGPNVGKKLSWSIHQSRGGDLIRSLRASP